MLGMTALQRYGNCAYLSSGWFASLRLKIFSSSAASAFGQKIRHKQPTIGAACFCWSRSSHTCTHWGGQAQHAMQASFSRRHRVLCFVAKVHAQQGCRNSATHQTLGYAMASKQLALRHQIFIQHLAGTMLSEMRHLCLTMHPKRKPLIAPTASSAFGSFVLSAQGQTSADQEAYVQSPVVTCQDYFGYASSLGSDHHWSRCQHYSYKSPVLQYSSARRSAVVA